MVYPSYGKRCPEDDLLSLPPKTVVVLHECVDYGN